MISLAILTVLVTKIVEAMVTQQANEKKIELIVHWLSEHNVSRTDCEKVLGEVYKHLHLQRDEFFDSVIKRHADTSNEADTTPRPQENAN